ncbi:fungal-specific transcription factor domain-containing protein [Mycena filopes]|nr:fungal-specific transcription factor domain-containing protein [Mycena filopes]
MSSSNEEDSYESEPTSKQKRRVQRACDMCRRKKRRCDGGDICDHCSKHNFVCTYVEPSTIRPALAGGLNPRTRGTASTTSKREIEALENRLQEVEALLEKSKTERSPAVQLLSKAIGGLNQPYPMPHVEDLRFSEVADSFRFLAIDDTAAQGFQGKSSGAMLVKAAVDLKNGRRKNVAPLDFPLITSQIETSEPPTAIYDFPDDDLLASLIDLYFSAVNPFLPLLHRPTFDAAVHARLHLTHVGFAKTVLLVCALGARYSTDTRVPLPDMPAEQTAGWRWFDQVKLSGHVVHAHPMLYDLQSYCLAAAFLDCTSSPRTCWTLVGFGMRLGQDIGAHRYRARSALPTFEHELEKRASWILFLYDAQTSTALGRSIAIQSYDFDIEAPLLVDDKYWSTPAPDPSSPPLPLFRQPADKPSRLAFFNCMLNLNRILSFSCKVLYPTNRSKTLLGLGGDQWEEQVVVELDSALNTWFDTIPPHLRWAPDIADDTFFDQAAILQCTAQHTRIIIHRPFIPAMRRASPTHLPSLAICNTAARACSHVAQIQQERRPNNPIWFSQTPLFTSGIVLLLNIWGGSNSNSTLGTGLGRSVAEKDLADVHRCMAVLSAQCRQWPSAGALLETLSQLVAVDHPAPNAAQTSNHGPARGPEPLNPSPSILAHAHAMPPLDMGFTAAYSGSDPIPFTLPHEHGFVAPPMYDPALETPLYDAALETPPPQDYLELEGWYGDGQPQQQRAHHPETPVYGGGGSEDGYMPIGEGSYGMQVQDPNSSHLPQLGNPAAVFELPLGAGNSHDRHYGTLGGCGFGGGGADIHGGGYSGNAEGQGSFGTQDGNFDMDIDMQTTIALWSQAPTSFGVADWDMYLGQFVDDLQQPGPVQTYSQY